MHRLNWPKSLGFGRFNRWRPLLSSFSNYFTMDAPIHCFRQPQNREWRLIELSPVKITARRVSPRATDIFEDTTEIFGNSIWARESRSTFAAKSSWWVMKIGTRRGREMPKGEKTSRILQLNPGCALPIPIPSISFSFSLFLSLLLRRTLFLYDLVALELCLFVPFSLLFSCYPVRSRLRQKSKSFFNSTDTPDSNSGFVNRFTWKRFYFLLPDKLRLGISMTG